MGVVWLLFSVLRVAKPILWVVIVPFIFAYSLYWMPVWLGANPDLYGAWAILFVGIWSFSGFFPSTLLLRFFLRRYARKE